MSARDLSALCPIRRDWQNQPYSIFRHDQARHSNRLCISRVVIHEYSTAELRFSEVREIPFTASFAFPDPTHLLCRQPSHSDE